MPKNNTGNKKIRTAELSLALIDDPEHPSRESFGEEELNELIQSMSDVGQIQDVSVKENGERFIILAGHRRTIAARALGWTTIRARVYPADTELADVIQVHENVVREELNPAEEAIYWWRLYKERCHEDTNELAAHLKISRQHVERRMALKTGDEDVFSALGQGLIGAGVAEELNRVKDKTRRMMYLDAAVRGGATRALIREWRSKGEAIDELQVLAPVPADVAAQAFGPNEAPRITCELCEQGVESGGIETMYVHRHCRRSMIDRLLALYQQQRSESPAVQP
jgi:ParB/RepB/Spo0J family partition protein